MGRAARATADVSLHVHAFAAGMERPSALLVVFAVALVGATSSGAHATVGSRVYLASLILCSLLCS